ncbi:MAG: ferritin-like domain-containing protein [Solirubrobacterales bacterium]
MLRRAALGSAAIMTAALAGPMLRPARSQAQAADDEALRDFLAPAIALEQVAALAYATAAEAEATDARSRRLYERFRDQEQAHANALRSALDSLGFDLPDAPDSPTDSEVFDDVDGLEDARATELTELLGGLEGLRGEKELLDHLARVEREQLRFYLDAAPPLDSEDLRRTSAEIVGNQAQHLVVLRRALGDDPATAAAAVSAAVLAADSPG